MFILIPPSERKSETPADRNDGPLSDDIAAGAKAALGKFRRKTRAEMQRLYGVKTEAMAHSIHVRNQRYDRMPTVKAIERYRGVMYDAIGYETLTNPEAADRRLMIVSALFGLISAATPIPEYKLPMQGWLATFWRPENTARLEALAEGKTVVNLLPQAHQRAIAYHPQVVVDFRVEGGTRSSGHFGKTIRGRFVRWLIENDIEDPADFAGFSEDGYEFDGTSFIQS